MCHNRYISHYIINTKKNIKKIKLLLYKKTIEYFKLQKLNNTRFLLIGKKDKVFYVELQ
mgnify:CR=1 FL=1